MKISTLYQQKKPVISFEIFPPKIDSPLETVFQTIDDLKDLRPDFISVTYGAGGTSRGRTIEIASRIKQEYKIESLAHLTCVGHSPLELDEVIGALKSEGIENILALGGDPPRDQPDFAFQPGHYRYAIELVRHIQRGNGFCVGAAAYAEGHIKCSRWSEDWDYLKEKIEAGVDFLLTQLFFDNRVFYNFQENMARLGVSLPVSAGIMPVLNPKQIRRILYLSGASLPARLLKLFDDYGENGSDFEKAGLDYAVEQIADLIANGADGIHLCTMNRAAQTQNIISNLGWLNSL
jgi:methylenetetrahydrofolate reductase (NADPH)